MPRKFRIEFAGVICHVSESERRLATQHQAEAPEKEWNLRRKGDPVTLGLATRLRKEASLTVKMSATRAHLGTSKSANARQQKWMRGTDLQAPHAGRLKICNAGHTMVTPFFS